MKATDLDRMMEQYGHEYRTFPPYETRHQPEAFFVASDTIVVMMDAETLTEAIQEFTDMAEGMPALYLIQDGEPLATYNGGQSDPEGELIYHVTKSSKSDWVAALTALMVED